MDIYLNPQQDAAASVSPANPQPINEVNSLVINSPQSCEQDTEMTSSPLVTSTSTEASGMSAPNSGFPLGNESNQLVLCNNSLAPGTNQVVVLKQLYPQEHPPTAKVIILTNGTKRKPKKAPDNSQISSSESPPSEVVPGDVKGHGVPPEGLSSDGNGDMLQSPEVIANKEDIYAQRLLKARAAQRERRALQKDSVFRLRKLVPELCDGNKVGEYQVMEKSADYIEELQDTINNLVKSSEVKEKERLESEEKLKREMSIKEDLFIQYVARQLGLISTIFNSNPLGVLVGSQMPAKKDLLRAARPNFSSAPSGTLDQTSKENLEKKLLDHMNQLMSAGKAKQVASQNSAQNQQQTPPQSHYWAPASGNQEFQQQINVQQVIGHTMTSQPGQLASSSSKQLILGAGTTSYQTVQRNGQIQFFTVPVTGIQGTVHGGPFLMQNSLQQNSSIIHLQTGSISLASTPSLVLNLDSQHDTGTSQNQLGILTGNETIQAFGQPSDPLSTESSTWQAEGAKLKPTDLTGIQADTDIGGILADPLEPLFDLSEVEVEENDNVLPANSQETLGWKFNFIRPSSRYGDGDNTDSSCAIGVNDDKETMPPYLFANDPSLDRYLQPGFRDPVEQAFDRGEINTKEGRPRSLPSASSPITTASDYGSDKAFLEKFCQIDKDFFVAFDKDNTPKCKDMADEMVVNCYTDAYKEADEEDKKRQEKIAKEEEEERKQKKARKDTYDYNNKRRGKGKRLRGGKKNTG